MQPVRLDQSAQAHAAHMLEALSQLFGTDTGITALGSAACTELQVVYTHNELLTRALSSHKQSDAADDIDDVQEACSRRNSLLDDILQQLDDSVCSLRSQLDSCHRVLRSAPCTTDPETIMQYAHTLRYGYQPLGILDYHPPVPPAPQDFHFIPSLLKRHHESRPQQRAVPAAAPQQPVPLVTQQHPQEQQQEQANPVEEQQQQLQVQQQAQQQPLQRSPLPVAGAVLGQLNEDLSDETADEELSETEDEDDDY